LQKSLHQARDIILNVAHREILKLQNYEADHAIFKLRTEGKSLKRAVGIKGDDHLFYPHKRKKIVKVKEEEENTRRDKKLTSRESSNVPTSGSAASRAQQVATQEETSSSTQPYVKLPPSKVPDMDLVTVSLVLKEKNETIKRAVLEKLRKRKEQDKGFINLTDNPYEPYFNITTNNERYKELSHIPYSSIAAANYHQINTSNYLSDSVKKILEEAKKPLPGVKTLRGSNGELIPSKPFPHLSSLLQDHINKSKSNNYISLLLSNIETHNFNAYNTGFAEQVSEDSDDSLLSDPVFRLRKRLGRNNRTFVDRRGLIQRPNDVLDEFLKFDDSEDTINGDDMDIDKDAVENKSSIIRNVYDSKVDAIARLDSRWKFDTDLSESQRGETDPFCLDPSRLNSISDDTQSIRFGSMLLSKSYGLLRDAVHQKQQIYLQQARLRAIQHSNRQQTQSASSTLSNEKSLLSEQQLLQRQQLQNKANSDTGLKSGSGNGGGSSSSSLTSQQSNGRSSNLSGSPLYNNNRSNKNSSDSKLTNNFNAQNIKHYNKSSTIASPNKASTPVSGSQK
jgi:enhancer of polycomb-like protein